MEYFLSFSLWEKAIFLNALNVFSIYQYLCFTFWTFQWTFLNALNVFSYINVLWSFVLWNFFIVMLFEFIVNFRYFFRNIVYHWKRSNYCFVTYFHHWKRSKRSTKRSSLLLILHSIHQYSCLKRSNVQILVSAIRRTT